MSNGKFLGSILLLAGTAVGAGMLALPMVSASTGFVFSTFLIIFLWALMTFTALLILEVNLAFKVYHNSFGTMAFETLGRAGQIVAWLTCLLLLYSLTSAYIAGNGSLLTTLIKHLFNFNSPDWINALLFTLILGVAVYWSTHTVDILNRFFISIKGILLLLTLILLMPHIQITRLIHQSGPIKYLWAAAPIFLTSFGFHTVIPSLTNYLGRDAKTLKRVILIGTIIPLIIYILWLAATLGIVPLYGRFSFYHVIQTHQSVGGFVSTLDQLIQNKFVRFSINGFSDIAMTTSFLGVSLGLFDFLADGFKRTNSHFGRLQTALLTFIPPLVFALYYPKGFILALGYAAIFVAILEIILPALMVMKLRKSKTLTSTYRVPGGKILLMLVILIGIALITCQLLSVFHVLPSFA